MGKRGPQPYKNHPGRPPVPVYDGEGPWPEGHTLSMLHGIYSQRVRDPIEERLAEVLKQAMREGLGNAYNPALDEHAIRRAARALATVEMAEAWVDKVGLEHTADSLLKYYKNASNAARHWLGELGLTPAARAKLGVDVARQYDLVQALSDRRAQRTIEATRLCDFCEQEPARFRVKSSRQVICRPCAEEGRHR